MTDNARGDSVTDSARGGPKIGVLVPYTNVNLEPDMEMMRPEGCTMHFARIGGYDMDEIPDADQMAGLGKSDIDEALRLISGVRPDVVLYGCTSATLTHGVKFDRKLAEKIAEKTGAVAITAAEALAVAIDGLDVGWKVGFSSPYTRKLNRRLKKFLTDVGFEVIWHVDIDRAFNRVLDNVDMGKMTPDDVYELALRVANRDIDAIVLSCTDMRAAEAVDKIEYNTGIPVVTSNQALIYAACRALDLPPPAEGGGLLFDRQREDTGKPPISKAF